VDALVGLQARVSVIDDLSNSSAEHLLGLVELDPSAVRFVHASILETGALDEAMAGAHTVFHLAAVGSVPLSIENPERSFAVNTSGTVRVLQAARRAGVKRVVYSASSSAYGDASGATGQPSAKVESAAPAPLSPYAASKLSGEHALRAWCRCYGLEGVGLRYFNVFGPRQAADTPYAAVIASFARKLLTGQRPVIHGDGTQSRDFTPVACAVAANLLAASCARELHGQVVNIGTGQRTDLLTLARLMAAKCGRPDAAPEFRPPRAGDVRHSLADITAARALLDYQPIGTLEEALTDTVSFYRQSLAGLP
jgi:nucleoside-diphosphate-sugar epimerase